jgi:DNA-binding transcriptional ArsR family regulator
VGDINLYMAYVDILLRHEEYDPAAFELAHALLNDPERLQATALSHLKVMWHEWMAPEWARTLPMTQASVEAFGRLDYSSMTVYEAIRRVTGRDMASQLDLEEAADVKHVIFVPSPHCGPYLSLTVDGDIMRVIFGARMPPEPARLGHDELLMLLSALDDDMRIRILILLAQHDELCSQDIMDHFNLTQSTASRHLRQLSATGLLTEERSGGAKKCYQLNRERVRALLQTLRESLVEPHKPGNRNLPLRLQALFLLLM